MARSVWKGPFVEGSLIKKAEKARQSVRSDVIKTALLRSVSHDLRSPLTAILASAEALHSPSLTADERTQLATSVSAEARMVCRLSS